MNNVWNDLLIAVAAAVVVGLLKAVLALAKRIWTNIHMERPQQQPQRKPALRRRVLMVGPPSPWDDAFRRAGFDVITTGPEPVTVPRYPVGTQRRRLLGRTRRRAHWRSDPRLAVERYNLPPDSLTLRHKMRVARHRAAR